MKPFYIPNALISATEKTVLAHPNTGRFVLPLSASDLKALVLAINAKEHSALPIFSRTLSLRQRMALCTYIPQNTYHVSLKKITTVLSSAMTISLFQFLFDVWQNAPDCSEVLSLLGETAEDPTYQSCLPVSNDFVVAWSQSSTPFYSIALVCRDRGNGSNFLARFRSMGFSSQKPLATACFSAFLQNANLNTFQVEGDDSISALLANVPISQQNTILLRLLHDCKPDYNVLLAFTRVYDYAYRLWGEPNAGQFPSEGQAYFDVYRWWYYYRQVELSFQGDKRRITYWKQYLHLCTHVQRNSSHAMLIMYFPNGVVTEFEIIGPVYIFDKEYFNSTVTPKLRNYKTAELKSWFYNDATVRSRETHTTYWESKQNSALRANHVI